MSYAKPITPPVNQQPAPYVLTAWDIPGLVHGFCGRTGGVSAGPFATFNLAGWIGDAPDAVAENWRRWPLLHPHLPVVRVRQVHGNLVHRIDSSLICSQDGHRRENEGRASDGPLHVGPEGDGMVTAAAGLALGIFTADCVPILMVDVERRIVAALHAGWRGTLAGIAAAGVQAMVALGARPTSIRAALGPSIGLCCFEVDAALAETFAREIPGAAAHSRLGGNLPRETPATAHPARRADSSGHAGREGAATEGVMLEGTGLENFPAGGSVRPGKAYLDLRAILRLQLEQEGIKPAAIANVGPCTRCANHLFFSRRGAVGTTSGLQMSFIGLVP